MRKRTDTRPLIEHAEGREQDSRSSLLAAFYSRQNLWNRRPVTNLHVRELLLYVMATDKDGRGVQYSYPELAERLCCTEATARKAVERASKDWGLLTVTEDRHARGGQTANRYSIDWAAVRRPVTRTHEPAEDRLSSHAGACRHTQGPVVSRQGAVVRQQPYKELTRTKPEAKASPSIPQNAAGSPEQSETTWEEVEEVLLGLPADRRPTAWQACLRSAQSSGVGPDHVLAILQHYTEHGPAYSAGALYRRLQRCHPQLPPSESWPQPSPSATGPTPQRRDLAIRQRVERIEFCTIRAGRSQGLSDVAIRDRIAQELRSQGLDPQLSEWCREASVGS